jgi:hypothetical protein
VRMFLRGNRQNSCVFKPRQNRNLKNHKLKIHVAEQALRAYASTPLSFVYNACDRRTSSPVPPWLEVSHKAAVSHVSVMVRQLMMPTVVGNLR